jgi:uncharacterized protein (TIRG00374 family)
MPDTAATEELENSASPPPKRSRLGGAIMRLIGLAGLGLFVTLIFKAGPRQIWEAVRHLSALEILALMGLRVLYWAVRAFNWQVILHSAGEHVSYAQVFGARIAGAAVSYLTPAGNIGGETMRIFMFDHIDRKKVLASVIVDKTVEFLAGILTVAVAIVLLITSFALSYRHQVLLFAITAAILALLLLLVAKQKRGLFTWMVDGLARLGIRIAAVERRREKIRETDAHIADLYNSRRGLFYFLYTSYLFQACLWAVEIYLTFAFMHSGRVSFLKSFIIVTLGSFYTFIPVPGAMGVYELTYVSLFALLGIRMSTGMAVILIRRILGLVWAGFGLVPILRKKAVAQKAPPPYNDRL